MKINFSHEGFPCRPCSAPWRWVCSPARPAAARWSRACIKGVLPVLVIMTVLSLAARLAGYGSVLGGLVGIFIIVMLPIGILTFYVLWKKGKIQVVDKEQK